MMASSDKAAHSKLDPTKMKDWEVAEAAEAFMKPVQQLADELGLAADELIPMGKQLAKDMMADMLDTALGALSSALDGTARLITDKTGDATPTCTTAHMHSATQPFGDRASSLNVWVMHSKPLHDLYAENIANAVQLFSYGTLNVLQDPFGRRFIMTDSSGLVNTTPVPDEYHSMCLQPGAIYVGQNNDFFSNVETSNGDENIGRTFQAEWTWQLGLKGWKWDVTVAGSGNGNSPTVAELATTSSWDRSLTDTTDQDKAMAGVKLITL